MEKTLKIGAFTIVLTSESAKYEDFADEISRRDDMERLLRSVERTKKFAVAQLTQSFKLGLITPSEYNRENRRIIKKIKRLGRIVYRYADAPFFCSTAKIISRAEKEHCKIYDAIYKIGERYAELIDRHQDALFVA